ncbi:hypothetical protein [Kibdelosporangium phytohabitans]|uniref:Uncharacterized protein n=1 Tax=Kibdelosporangium phytohabitans TaxID=860235 RepID=A0A0N9HQ49_9PSEU|nr:hypothetical protein [Kibdelosporangium phytohabitans]ALG09217.1 hypothetical protein AOZ06_21940 [Kibdelosporangium phytohabitans]MBE1469549.1 hypothetical protein [Kibdelosporangium phytohabitans]
MTSKLERRYRVLLRLLPGWYREKRADEMVDTFISGRPDDVDQEHGWPGWAEAGAVAALAVRTRLSGADGPPRAVALGGAVRLVAMIGLLAHAVLSVGDIVRAVSTQLIPPLGLEPTSYFWRSAAGVAAVGAFVLIFTRWRGTAKALAVTAVVPTLFDLVITLGSSPPADAVLWQLSALAPLWIATICLFVGFHREAPVPWPRVWVWAAVIGAAVVLAWNWYARFVVTDVAGLWLNPWSLQNWVIVFAGLAVLALGIPPYVRLGLATYIALTLPQAAVAGFQMAGLTSTGVLVSLAISGVTCLVLVGIALAVTGARGHLALSAGDEPFREAV